MCLMVFLINKIFKDNIFLLFYYMFPLKISYYVLLFLPFTMQDTLVRIDLFKNKQVKK